MSRKKGIIMKVEKRKAYILTPEGEFRQCASEPHWMAGDEVQIPELRSWTRRVPYGVAAAAVLLVLMTIFFPFNGGSSTHRIVAYVTLDINPSIELGIDQDNIVRSAEGLNLEGEQIIQRLAPVGSKLDETASAIIKSADEAGVIARHIAGNSGEIVVTTTVVTEEEWDSNTVREKVKQSIQAELAVLHKDDASKVNIDDVATPPAVREEARREGISTGKMAVKLLAENKGLELSSEQLQQQPIGQVLKEAGGMSSLLDQADTGKTAAQLLNELVDKRRHGKVQQTNQPVHTTLPDPKYDETDKGKGKEHPGQGKAAGHNKDKPNVQREKPVKKEPMLPVQHPKEKDQSKQTQRTENVKIDKSSNDREREKGPKDKQQRMDEKKNKQEERKKSNERKEEEKIERGEEKGEKKERGEGKRWDVPPPENEKQSEERNGKRSDKANDERDRREDTGTRGEEKEESRNKHRDDRGQQKSEETNKRKEQKDRQKEDTEREVPNKKGNKAKDSRPKAEGKRPKDEDKHPKAESKHPRDEDDRSHLSR